MWGENQLKILRRSTEGGVLPGLDVDDAGADVDDMGAEAAAAAAAAEGAEEAAGGGEGGAEEQAGVFADGGAGSSRG